MKEEVPAVKGKVLFAGGGHAWAVDARVWADIVAPRSGSWWGLPAGVAERG
jgi:hypothetical protein